MKPIEHTLTIEAPPQAVWDTLLAVEHWPSWTPTMKRVERIDSGVFGVGSRARIWLTGVPASSVWEVTSLVPQRSFSWRTRTMGVTNIADHEIAPAGAGTRLTLRITMSGPATLVLAPMLGRVARRNLPLEAEGLKRWCERRSSVGYEI